MEKIWMIANSASASMSADALADVHACFDAQGVDVARRVDLAKDDLPDVVILIQEMPVSCGRWPGKACAYRPLKNDAIPARRRE